MFTPTPMHDRFARLTGRWKGTARTWLDPNAPPESAPWEGTLEMVLGGRYLRFTYESRALGQAIAGELTVAYEAGDRVVRMSWIDSFHTSPAILVSQSEPVPDAGAPAIHAFGTYFAGEGQPRWGWRTELDDSTGGALRLRMRNVTPSGEESLAVDVELVRA